MSYHKIQDNFWIDEKVRSWDLKTKMVAFYLLNNQHKFSEGLYYLPISYAAEDTKLTQKEIETSFRILCSDHFIKYDRNNSIVLIVNALKYQPLQNINHCKAALKKLKQLPRTPLLNELIKKAKIYNPKFYQLLKKKSQNIKFLKTAFKEILNNGLDSAANKGYKSTKNNSQALSQSQALIPILTQNQTLTQKNKLQTRKNEIIFKENKIQKLEDLEKLNLYLIELIETNNHRVPLPAKDTQDPDFKKWLKDLEKLHFLGPIGAKKKENKGYSLKEIKALINFSQQDQFWKTNILNAKSLRKQVLKLENKMKSSKSKPKSPQNNILKNLYLAAKKEEEKNEKI